ncbi:Glutathione import ATP-binding protein GsiA [uncultured Clostridium sp.]|uniref:ABC transporter ATP-binding protein n=1 Tax=uncultured Clostridium sp. TaxID=59620 RepID=UPI000822AC96|nr:ABC transporter ATP-binding protein [uncultured Clostridium sp.]SCJ97184.1 Glutathione import ATP-binding protein GsiA [uncultured Clostridium sp.]
MNNDSILKVEGLTIDLITESGKVRVIDNISFRLRRGKTIGIIGESGSGKSITCSAILGLLERRKWSINGNVYFKNSKVIYGDKGNIQELRGNHIAVIRQNPMNSFNPLITIREHFIETLKSHRNISRKEISIMARTILMEMKIQNVDNVLDSYSFQLSGGMLQRIMIALAVVLEPEILIADEPTTALDLTVQYEILKILARVQKKYGTAIILVSHDLGVISDLADDVVVMYSGNIIENAPINEIVHYPKHPYTKSLMESRPKFSKERLTVLEGVPPRLGEVEVGCKFYNRCNMKSEVCIEKQLCIIKVNENHDVKCILYKEELYNCGNA